MQSRTIKALSDQQLSDLNPGRGMGLALAAELNGYSGHLKYHLSTADILNPSQMQRYAELRGYTGNGGHQKLHHH